MRNVETSQVETLAALLGPRHCLTAAEDMAPYAVDWRGTWRGQPLAVLKPGTVEEVSAAVAACAEAGIAVVPAGGRTGLCGAAVVSPGGPPAVVLSLERLNRIRDVDARDFSLVAEAGCVVQRVQEAAAEAGRLFPIAWGAQGSAQIGGMLSTNAGGIRTLRWGNARELVLGLEVVLPDGRVLNDLRRVRKDNSGYALRHLFLGAEGTLGVITAAALRLVPALQRVETAFLAVPSPDAALSLLGRMLGSGAEVIACELIQRICLEMVAEHGPHLRLPLPLESPWYVMVELAAAHPAVPVRAMLESALEAALEAGECTDAVLAENEAQRRDFWRIREDFPEFSRMAGPSIATDTAVPVSAVPEFLARVEAALAARWPEGRMVAIGHAGDGNIHVGLKAPPGVTREAWAARAGAADMVVNEIAMALGGSFSAEHGIGVSKLHVMRALKDKLALEMMRAIKQTLDPRGVMNPGKVLPEG
ncbi:FAD-binding oxidoreductase [Siccirubricoccus sp. KC 17139]|uniref:FAD-binding oxidoreductase n=1 Tax=Siccirubricoccus soli TaxID=2899147 RepID=A0ABT1D160_9PROT|nr:FAD-binding oxidoreductase [Siccirubricoccus soli]MCO6415646.1 FAD-binding oxidoreductase [Siccirubricoccus soli]MCP2681778.1 FAD-binding oxidoreductase [Siccirubricoccus soli]